MTRFMQRIPMAAAMQRLAVAAAICGLAAAPAIAQVFDMGSLTNTLTIGSGSTGSRDRAAGRAIDQAPLGLAFGRALSGSRGSGVAASVNTRFTPSKAVRARNFAQFVAKTRTVDAKAADDLEKTFAKRDVIAEIGRGIAPFGLRTDDVADAATAYLTTAWYGARGSDETPSQAQVDGVRTQMANAIASTPQFQAATPAMKQELAEALLVQALLVGQAATYAGNQPALRAKVGAAVAQGANATFGFDLRRMSMTAAGLRPR